MPSPKTVTVTAPVIETSTAEIGHYVSTKEFQTWPVAVGDGQRQIQQFIFSSLPGTTGSTFEGAINGGRNYSHEILIEGIPLGRNLQGGSNNEMSPPTEAISEFKLQTGTLGAEFGGGQTAVANFVVKSGTNDFHGSGAVYLMDAAWDARPFVGQGARPGDPGEGPAELGRRRWEGRSRCRSCTAERIAASSSRRSSRRTPKNRRRRRSARCRRVSSRTATSHASSIRPTRAMPARARSIGTDALGRPIRFGQIYDPRTTRVVDGRVVRDPFPNNQIPRAVWDAVARNTLETGTLGRAAARSPVQQPAGARDLLPGVRSEHVRDEARPGDQRETPGLVLREPRVADAQQFARRTLRPAARVADEPVPAAEDSKLDDPGVRELGDQRSAPASLRVRLQPLRERQPERLFQRRAGPRGSACATSRTRRSRGSTSGRERRFWADWLGQFRLRLARRELRGQHHRPGRSDLHHRTPQHQDRLRGTLLLRRQRDRRRDGHLQLQFGADEPAGVRSADRPCLRELSARRRRQRPAVPSRPSTRTTSSAISASTCRTTSRSPPSSR